jgi:plastocyanin
MKTTPKSKARLFPAILISFAIATIFMACAMRMKSDMTDRGPGVVWLKGDAFSPNTVTVPVNTTVTWTNKDFWAHTVTSDNDLFDSGKLKSHKTFSYKFTKAGTYAYHCSVHKMMVAKVIVK